MKKNIEFNSDDCNQCSLCIEACPVDALKWTSNQISSEDVIREIIKDKIFYDISDGGITFSGGEPLYQIEFCLELAKKSKELGLHVAVDTSGFVEIKELKRIIPFVDLFLYDLKFVNKKLHEKYTGKSNDLILKNLKMLCKEQKEITVRVPLIPGVTDNKENLNQINKFVNELSHGIKIDYIPFNHLVLQKNEMLGRKCLIMEHIKKGQAMSTAN